MRKISIIAVLAIIFTHCYKLSAQGLAISSTNIRADTSAILDVSSTNQGVLVPRMTIAQRNAIVTPARGLLIFQNDSMPGFYFFDGIEWTSLRVAKGATGNNGQGVPVGGTAEQVLSKVDATDYNTHWVNLKAMAAASFTLPLSPMKNTATNGAGTFYLTRDGLDINEADCHQIVPFACTKIILTSSATGVLGSGYTLSLRIGVSNGVKYDYSDIPNSNITITDATPKTLILTGLNIAAGNTIAIRIVGTASIVSQGKGLYNSCVLLQ